MREMQRALVIYLLALLFSAIQIRSDQNPAPIRSFKLSENAIYNCIDINKQPGLDHPLLKNHTIQMKPSFQGFESQNQTSNTKTYKKKIRCPYGTVPILRNSKEYIDNAKLFKDLHLLKKDSSEPHIAGVRTINNIYRGVKARFSIHNLKIGRDQASYTQMYIGTRRNDEFNFITAGWMINQNLYGDGRVWSYGYWMSKYGNGCYNNKCPWFVQVSQEVPLAQPLDPQREPYLYYSIHEDKQTGNWWLTKSFPRGPDINIGYWPVHLFNLMVNGADAVGVAGRVQTSSKGYSPPMGNGKFPSKLGTGSAVCTNIEVLDSKNVQTRIDAYPIDKLLDSPQCYDLYTGKMPILGFFFSYGGPGGDYCHVRNLSI